MKKVVTLIVLAIFTFITVTSFAAYYVGNNFCSFNGILNGTNRPREDEFNMLFEPPENPNYEAVSSAVGALTVVPEKDLNNKECKVHKYTKDLLEFYDKNKSEMVKKKPEIAELLEFIKKRFTGQSKTNVSMDSIEI